MSTIDVSKENNVSMITRDNLPIGSNDSRKSTILENYILLK